MLFWQQTGMHERLYALLLDWVGTRHMHTPSDMPLPADSSWLVGMQGISQAAQQDTHAPGARAPNPPDPDTALQVPC